ncbi:MAG: hypothetical protein ACRD3C_15350 [Vicinamibacterales bacterium]
MLQWFRARASSIAATAMLSMAAAGGSAVVPHEDDCHDAACRAIDVEHNAAAHRIGAASAETDNHPLHCLVCHWARAFRPPTEARVVSTPSTDAAVNVNVETVTISGRAPVAQPPLRSPPA